MYKCIVFLSLLLPVILVASSSGCSDGTIACPPNTPSSGICVPSIFPYCSRDIWLNPFASPTLRAADLIPRLTLSERVNLLQTTPINASEVPRLGIVRSTTAECLHGYCSNTPSTVFPQSTTLAASFNAPLIEAVAAAIGKEARAWRNAWVQAGSNSSIPPPSLTCFAPQINIQRDPRWGRGQETYGEDPFLTAIMVGAYVNGLQNGGKAGGGGGYMLAAATTKHFLAYQGASTRELASPTEVYLSWHDQIDTYEPAWRAAVTAGSAGVMCAYSSLCHDDTNTTCSLPPPIGFGISHGIPMCANDEMINGWLRHGADSTETTTWDGLVVGDCGAVQFIETDHHWTTSQEAAAAAALNAGVDFDCSISVGKGFATLVNASDSGLVNVSSIDRALSRLFLQQFKLGLYDDADLVPWSTLDVSTVVNSVAHRGLAAQAAREGIVLLSNRDSFLPLNPSTLSDMGSVLVTGPNSLLVASGNYATTTDVNVTAFQGISAALPLGATVLSLGCVSVTSNDTSGFAAAVTAASNSRVIIAAMGLDGSVEYEDSTRTDLALPGVQEELLRALVVTGKPLIIVLFGGSAVVPSPFILSRAAAVIWAGYGGEEAGTALSQVIFGLYNPSGRLPFTFYQNVTHLPSYSNQSLRGLPFGRTHRYFTGPEPTFRFGDGISYSTFNVTVDSLSTTTLPICDSLLINVSVQNNGPFDGDTVIMVFLRLLNTTLAVPLHALVGFTRLSITSHSTQTTLFTLKPDAFVVIDGIKRQRILEPSTALIYVGTNQPHETDWESALPVIIDGPSNTPIQNCSKTTGIVTE